MPRPEAAPKCTADESAEMLDFFFKQVGAMDVSKGRFQVWLELCKKVNNTVVLVITQLVFAELYPLACMRIDILDANDHGGFRPNCPTTLHKVLNTV